MNFVPCVTWVKRGVAKRIPDKVQISKDELKQIIESHAEELNSPELSENESDDENGDRQQQTQQVDEPMVEEDPLAIYDLNNYDDEEDPITNPLAGLAGLTLYASNDDDPYVTVKGDDDPDDEDNFEIRPDDNLVVVGRINGDACGLDIYVYNEKDNHLYVHHDVLLPSVPLCSEWLNFDPAESDPGNLIAVGLMNSVIQIWDIDVVDSLEPAFQLGRPVKKKKKKSSVKGHGDAVLDLSWNKSIRNVLASGSVDKTIALWDMSEGTIVTSIAQFRDKVQTIEWHPVEAQMLLAGSYDNTVKLFDCRSPESTNKSWTLNGEIERVIWNHHNPLLCYASTDSGLVYCLDPRVENPLWQIGAHSGNACTGLAISSQIPGCLVTASTDKSLKVWDIQSGQPIFVREKSMKMGQIHCLQPNPDSGNVFCCGGDNKSHNFVVCNVNEQGTSGVTYDEAPTLDELEDYDVEDFVAAPSASSSTNNSSTKPKSGLAQKKRKPK